MSALIVGCDPSTKRLCFFGIHPVLPTAQPLAYALGGKTDVYTPEKCVLAFHAAAEAAAQFARMARPRDDRILYIEEPLVGRGGIRTTMKQAFISGTVQACFIMAGFKVELVNQSTWKAWYHAAGAGTGNSGSSKSFDRNPCLGSMRLRFPKDVRAVQGDSDLLDAAAIARWGEAKYASGGR